jgi:hypothetical protein
VQLPRTTLEPTSIWRFGRITHKQQTSVGHRLPNYRKYLEQKIDAPTAIKNAEVAYYSFAAQLARCGKRFASDISYTLQIDAHRNCGHALTRDAMRRHVDRHAVALHEHMIAPWQQGSVDQEFSNVTFR